MINTTQQLISILGTTATGKTELALFLANKILEEKLAQGVTLISADSRQVYQGLEILTGADIPQDFSFKKELAHGYRFAKHDALPIFLHGISIIKPAEEWSVAHFRNLAVNLINQAWNQDFISIIVGGTSFYHKQLFNNDPDIYIKPNQNLRQKLESLSVDQLREKLQKSNPTKFNKMNQSDQANPRRLIRALEVTKAIQNLPDSIINRPIFHRPEKYLAIGLQADLKTLESKISKRVKARFKNRAVAEVKQLLSLNLPQTAPVLSTLGVTQISAFLNQNLSANETIQDWSLAEFQYAKRQITWLKRMKIDMTVKLPSANFQKKIWGRIKKS